RRILSPRRCVCGKPPNMATPSAACVRSERALEDPKDDRLRDGRGPERGGERRGHAAATPAQRADDRRCEVDRDAPRLVATKVQRAPAEHAQATVARSATGGRERCETPAAGNRPTVQCE